MASISLNLPLVSVPPDLDIISVNVFTRHCFIRHLVFIIIIFRHPPVHQQQPFVFYHYHTEKGCFTTFWAN